MNRNSEFKDLKQTLDALDLSQSWAAKQLGVSPTYVGLILAGKAKPSEALKGAIGVLRDKLKGAGLRAV